MVTGENLGLHSVRQISIPTWQHALVTDTIADSDYVSNLTSERGTVFPLYRFPNEMERAMGEERRANFSERFIAAFCEASGFDPTDAPESVLGYIYSTIHSPNYRSRYIEFLKIDFARIPLPYDRTFFDELAGLGLSLIDLHLLRGDEVENAPSRYTGRPNLTLGKATYEMNAVAVDDAKRNRFEGVPEETWEFTVGGYKPAQKWLKDRKGRVLTEADIRHYEKMLFAMEETMRIMGEIDEVIEEHGGWPAAFQGDANG
jgi:predicted helicase